MHENIPVSGHYTSGDLLARLEARLREDGFDPAHPTFEAVASPHLCGAPTSYRRFPELTVSPASFVGVDRPPGSQAVTTALDRV